MEAVGAGRFGPSHPDAKKCLRTSETDCLHPSEVGWEQDAHAVRECPDIGREPRAPRGAEQSMAFASHLRPAEKSMSSRSRAVSYCPSLNHGAATLAGLQQGSSTAARLSAQAAGESSAIQPR